MENIFKRMSSKSVTQLASYMNKLTDWTRIFRNLRIGQITRTFFKFSNLIIPTKSSLDLNILLDPKSLGFELHLNPIWNESLVDFSLWFATFSKRYFCLFCIPACMVNYLSSKMFLLFKSSPTKNVKPAEVNVVSGHWNIGVRPTSTANWECLGGCKFVNLWKSVRSPFNALVSRVNHSFRIQARILIRVVFYEVTWRATLRTASTTFWDMYVFNPPRSSCSQLKCQYKIRSRLSLSTGLTNS